MQVEAPDLAWADVDIVGAGGVTGVWAAQKAKTIGQNFQNPICKNLLSSAGTAFDDGKHQFLLAHSACVFNFQGFGLRQQLGYVEYLKFV